MRGFERCHIGVLFKHDNHDKVIGSGNFGKILEHINGKYPDDFKYYT